MTVVLLPNFILSQESLASNMSMNSLSKQRSDKSEITETKQIKNSDFIKNKLVILEQRVLTDTELQELSDFVKNNTENSDAHLAMARAYFNLGLQGLYCEELEKCWRCDPSRVHNLLYVLKFHMDTANRPAFDRLIKEALSVYQNSPADLVRLAKILHRSREDEAAKKYCELALSLRPNDTACRITYCFVLLKLRDYKKSIEAAKMLLAYPPTEVIANQVIGTAYLNLSKLNLAEKYLEKAFAKNPKAADLASAYAECLALLGKYNEAIAPGYILLALEPPFTPLLTKAKTKLMPFISHTNKKSRNEALEFVRKTMAGSLSPFFYFALADVLDRTSKRVEATEMYTEGIKLDPSFARGYMRLAHDYELMGADRNAVMCLYEKAYGMNPDDKEIALRYKLMQLRLLFVKNDYAAELKGFLNCLRYAQ